jgi:HSP20 family protein
MSQLVPEQRMRGREQRRTQLTDLEQIGERMRQLLEETFGELATEAAGWVPTVDIEEQDDAWVLELEVPGVKREDVNIEMVGNELTVTGEVKETERKGIVRRKTRRVGRFEYRVVLPDGVDSENIEANLENGVLRVRVPKAQRAQRRRIEVTSSS